MHPIFWFNEKILKNAMHISLIDHNNKIRFIIYYKKSKTLDLVVNNNYFPPTKIMEKIMLFINLNVLWENTSPTIKNL